VGRTNKNNLLTTDLKEGVGCGVWGVGCGVWGVGRWGSGEMGKWGNGGIMNWEMGKWSSGVLGEFQLKPQHPKTLKP